MNHKIDGRPRQSIWYRLVALFAVAAMVAACGGSDDGDAASDDASDDDPQESPASDEPTQGGSLTVAVELEWVPLDPLGMATVTDRILGHAVYDTLLDIDEEGQVVPGLASDWTINEAGTVYTFTLREGVTFHDGTAFDAAAVVAHLDRLRNPENACRCLSSLAVVDTVEASGTHEVTITLSEPFAPLLGVLADIVGMIPSPTAVSEAGGSYGSEPVGTGPFQFDAAQDGSHITFAAYDEYWRDGLPYLDEVIYRPIPDGQARYAALRAGDVNLITTPLAADRVDAGSDDQLKVIELGGLGTRFVVMNMAEGPLADVDARRAVAMATDTETIRDELYSGTVSLTESPFPESMWAETHPETYPEYDPDAAAALVEDLGGLSFTLNLNNSPETVELAQALQGMWRAAGIEVELAQFDPYEMGSRVLGGNYQASIFRWGGRIDPGQNVYRFFHSNGISNWTGVSNPELDAALDAGRATTDRAEREAAYADVANILGEELPYLFLYGLDGAFITDASVHGVPATPDWLLRPAEIWLTEP